MNILNAVCFSLNYRVTPVHSFVDYIQGGCQINLLVAIDFTVSYEGEGERQRRGGGGGGMGRREKERIPMSLFLSIDFLYRPQTANHTSQILYTTSVLTRYNDSEVNRLYFDISCYCNISIPVDVIQLCGFSSIGNN